MLVFIFPFGKYLRVAPLYEFITLWTRAVRRNNVDLLGYSVNFHDKKCFSFEGTLYTSIWEPLLDLLSHLIV